MIKLGKMQKLMVVRQTTAGAYLSPQGNLAQEVLLPKGQVPMEIGESEAIEVFIYKDSEGRLTATTTRPKLTLDEIAFLRVKEVNELGAFLDWGLPKDLFLPYGEQRIPVKEGHEYMVGLYIDNSDRLSATMQIYDFLRTDSSYRMDDWVTAIVYDLENDLGALVAVDRKYSALIPKSELITDLRLGQILEARIVRVREDGKLDLSLRDLPGRQLDKDAEMILTELKNSGGFLPYNDSSSPAAIRVQFGLSKGSFKKAVGRLLKRGIIKLDKDGIAIQDRE